MKSNSILHSCSSCTKEKYKINLYYIKKSNLSSQILEDSCYSCKYKIIHRITHKSFNSQSSNSNFSQKQSVILVSTTFHFSGSSVFALYTKQKRIAYRPPFRPESREENREKERAFGAFTRIHQQASAATGFDDFRWHISIVPLPLPPIPALISARQR